MIELGHEDTGPADRQADLLLVVPAFGEFASGVKPVERRLFAGPRDREQRGGEGVERLVEGGGLQTDQLHPFDEEGGAETAVDGDAFAVETVDEGDQIAGAMDGGTLDKAGIASEGELAGGGVEPMGGDILHGPGGHNDGQIPAGSFERRGGAAIPVAP